MRYKIYYNFNGYGSTWIEADDEEAARTLFYDGEYERDDEETENYEIESTESEEVVQRRRNEINIVNRQPSIPPKEKYCTCGNPIDLEKEAKTCDQCWAEKQK